MWADLSFSGTSSGFPGSSAASWPQSLLWVGLVPVSPAESTALNWCSAQGLASRQSNGYDRIDHTCLRSYIGRSILGAAGVQRERRVLRCDQFDRQHRLHRYRILCRAVLLLGYKADLWAIGIEGTATAFPPAGDREIGNQLNCAVFVLLSRCAAAPKTEPMQYCPSCY